MLHTRKMKKMTVCTLCRRSLLVRSRMMGPIGTGRPNHARQDGTDCEEGRVHSRRGLQVPGQVHAARHDEQRGQQRQKLEVLHAGVEHVRRVLLPDVEGNRRSPSTADTSSLFLLLSQKRASAGTSGKMATASSMAAKGTTQGSPGTNSCAPSPGAAPPSAGASMWADSGSCADGAPRCTKNGNPLASPMASSRTAPTRKRRPSR